MGSITEPGSHQGLAVLGIALISMGEDIGPEDLQLPGRQRVIDWRPCVCMCDVCVYNIFVLSPLHLLY